MLPCELANMLDCCSKSSKLELKPQQTFMQLLHTCTSFSISSSGVASCFWRLVTSSANAYTVQTEIGFEKHIEGRLQLHYKAAARQL